jgi:Mrp family chromosome partitioning ATPase
MQKLVEQLAGRYDRVILDVPPTLGLPEAKTLCDMCDGIVFVVRSDETPSLDVESALDVLDRRRMLGLVLNGVEADPERYGYSGY